MDGITASVERLGARNLIHVVGTVTRDAAGPLRAAWDQAKDGLDSATVDGITIDFSRMEYLNSSGIAVLVGLLADARVAGIPVAAEGLSDHFVHVFEITRISDLIDIRQGGQP